MNDGHYRVLRTLGAGGFGITYLCEGADSLWALKEYFPSGAERVMGRVQPGRLSETEFQEGMRRFEREARVLSSFEHPYIVSVEAFFRENGTAYLVTEYVEGEVLASHHRGWLRPLVGALQAVHQLGLVHGDIKPENILVRPDGRPVLIDFGCSRPSHLEPTACMVSQGYSPPEQYSGQPLTPASDQYALAATWMNWRYGKPALEGNAPSAVARALSRQADKRWPDLEQFLAALEEREDPFFSTQAGWIRALTAGPGWLAAGGEDRQVRLWSTVDWSLRVVGRHSGWVNALALDSSRLFSLGTDRWLHAFHLESGELLWQMRLERVPHCAQVLDQVLWVGDEGGQVQAINLQHQLVSRVWKVAQNPVTSLAVWGGVLACNGNQERIGLWELASGQLLENLKGHQGVVRCLCEFRDVLYSGAADRQLRRWDWREGCPQLVGETSGTPWRLLADEDGLVSADGAKQVTRWNGRGATLLGEHRGEVRCLAAVGERVAAAGQDGQIRLHPGAPAR